jgi:hypothetical protein
MTLSKFFLCLALLSPTAYPQLGLCFSVKQQSFLAAAGRAAPAERRQ